MQRVKTAVMGWDSWGQHAR